MPTEHDITISTVAILLKVVPAVKEETSCLKVLEHFHDDKNLYAIPVVNHKERPTGIVIRQDFTELFSKRYQVELKGKKPISSMMDSNPIIVDVQTGIDDIARIILDAGIQHMVSGFIITKDKQYVGMGNGYDLLNEITNLKQKHLFRLAHFDQLTGLPNRTLMLDRMNQVLSVSSRASRAISLLFIDLDGFKPVNDTYGHATGDRLLKEVAMRLQSCLREGDTASRIGGDEFVVILVESDLDRAALVATRILEQLRIPYEFGKKTISNVSASIGIAEYPEHADDMSTLLIAADNAMYKAKSNGKDRFAIYAQP